MQTIYALIDCNNFFVSCERLFQPHLNNKPVVVLSSNDGCAVSRSQEAKDLGIPMGAPHFKFRDFFSQHDVTVFSANFELYGDISERIVNLLASITPHIEVYSVDESFLDLGQLDIPNYTAWGRTVRDTILRCVGVPVSIGIAPSKTLAKLANNCAKRLPALGGVLDLSEQGSATDTYLRQVPIHEVWGVGRQLAPRLRAMSVHTALDLRCMPYKRAQQLMGIHGRHMVYELNGTTCLPLQYAHKPQVMIMRGRQFGEDTRQLSVIEAAVASLVGRAAATLRREHQLTRQAAIVLRTSRHKPGYASYSVTVKFYTPTADTGIITSQLVRMLRLQFRPSLDYHKAEVLLCDFVPEHSIQTDILGLVDTAQAERSQARMRAIDHLNIRHGKGTIRYAGELMNTSWRPRHKLGSPHYTSAWSELPEARLGSPFTSTPS